MNAENDEEGSDSQSFEGRTCHVLIRCNSNA